MSNDKKAPGLETRHTVVVKLPSGKGTIEMSQKGRQFTVLSFNDGTENSGVLAFSPSGPGVENLDESSDAIQCFNRSTRIRIGDVVLANDVMKASSLDELKAALAKAKILPFNPEEI